MQADNNNNNSSNDDNNSNNGEIERVAAIVFNRACPVA